MAPHAHAGLPSLLPSTPTHPSTEPPPQYTRMGVLDHFKNGTTHVLVATDIAARGLDIRTIKWVRQHACVYACAVETRTYVCVYVSLLV